MKLYTAVMLGVILLVTLVSVLNASPVKRKTPPPEYKPMANDEGPQKPDNVRPSRPAWVKPKGPPAPPTPNPANFVNKTPPTEPPKTGGGSADQGGKGKK